MVSQQRENTPISAANGMLEKFRFHNLRKNCLCKTLGWKGGSEGRGVGFSILGKIWVTSRLLSSQCLALQLEKTVGCGNISPCIKQLVAVMHQINPFENRQLTVHPWFAGAWMRCRMEAKAWCPLRTSKSWRRWWGHSESKRGGEESTTSALFQVVFMTQLDATEAIATWSDLCHLVDDNGL